MSQLSSAISSRASQRPRRRLASPAPARRPEVVHVVVDWSPAGAAAPARVELEAERRDRPTWICRESAHQAWEDAISTSSCDEVVLTSWLGDDLAAKGVVLALAEHLTQTLVKTQPLIRVRFLPRLGA